MTAVVVTSAALDTGNPFVGLRAFTEDLRQPLFGRDRDVVLVVDRVTCRPTTLLFAASGVGKTSFLNMKVVPELRHDYNVVMHGEWSEHRFPLEPVKRKIGALAGVAVDPASPLREVLALASEGPNVQHPVRWCLVLDQFEEIFQHHTYKPEFRATIEDLCDAIRSARAPLAVIFSMREEFLGELSVFDNRIPDLFGNYYRLKNPSTTLAHAIIRSTVDTRADLDEEGLVRLVRDLSMIERGVGSFAERPTDGDGEMPADERLRTMLVERDFVIPPYLQIVCKMLWDERRPNAPFLGNYVEGRARKILDEFCRRQIANLAPREQWVAFKAFDFLVTKQGAKMAYECRSLARHAQLPESEVRATLEKLSTPERRILRASTGPDGSQWFELYHDIYGTIIDRWKTDYSDQRRIHRKRQVVAAAAAVVLVFFLVGFVLIPGWRVLSLRTLVNNTTSEAGWQEVFAQAADVREPVRHHIVYRGAAARLWAAFWERKAAYAEQGENRTEALLARFAALEASPSDARRRAIARLLRPADEHLLAALPRPPSLSSAFLTPAGDAVVTFTRDRQLRVIPLDGSVDLAVPAAIVEIEAGEGEAAAERSAVLQSVAPHARYRLLGAGLERIARTAPAGAVARVWRADTGKYFGPPLLSDRAIAATLGSSGRIAAALADDGRLTIGRLNQTGDAFTPQSVLLTELHTAGIEARRPVALSIDPRERWVLAASGVTMCAFMLEGNTPHCTSWPAITRAVAGPDVAIVTSGRGTEIVRVPGFEVIGRLGDRGVAALRDDGRTIVSATAGAMNYWNAVTGGAHGRIPALYESTALQQVRFDRGGNRFLVASRSGSEPLRVYQIPDRPIDSTITASASSDQIVQSSSDGSVIAVQYESNGSTRTELRRGNSEPLLAIEGTVAEIVITGRGRYATLQTDSTARLVEIPTTGKTIREIASWEERDFPIVAENGVALAWMEDRRLHLQDALGWTTRTLDLPERPEGLVVDPEGRAVATTSSVGGSTRIEILRLELSGFGESIVRYISGSIQAIRFLPSGTLIVGADDNRTYAIRRDDPEGITLQHAAPVTAIAPVSVRNAPRAEMVLTGSADGTIRLWSVTDNRLVGPVQRCGSSIAGFEMMPAGGTAVAFSDGWAHALRIDASGVAVTASVPVPRGPDGVVAAVPEGDGIRVVEGTTLASYRTRLVTFDGRGETPVAGDPTELRRRWEGVLGQRFDDHSGALIPRLTFLPPVIEQRPTADVGRSIRPR